MSERTGANTQETIEVDVNQVFRPFETIEAFDDLDSSLYEAHQVVLDIPFEFKGIKGNILCLTCPDLKDMLVSLKLPYPVSYHKIFEGNNAAETLKATPLLFEIHYTLSPSSLVDDMNELSEYVLEVDFGNNQKFQMDTYLGEPPLSDLFHALTSGDKLETFVQDVFDSTGNLHQVVLPYDVEILRQVRFQFRTRQQVMLGAAFNTSWRDRPGQN